ncbi:MAG: hypothetical protein DHS20C15_03350 [Planctomycetota bacterium]|nr:MAG: hypothetical protein DHS20C15_03350 [Planctomycetota bacterium]
MTPRFPQLAVFTVILALFSCGSEPSRVDQEHDLRPGDSLLDEPARLRVEQLALSSLPAGLPEAAAGVLITRTFLVPPTQWSLSEQPVEDSDLPRHAGPAGDYQRYITRPALRLDLALGDQWLQHAGEPASPHVPPRRRGQDMTRIGDWTGADNRIHFRWDAEAGELHALAQQLPELVEYGYHSTRDSLMAYVETSQPAPADAADLVRRVTLQEVDRPAVLAPAPSVLSASVRPLGDALRVAVGALPLGFADRNGQLVRDDTRSDGTTFAVDVVNAEGATRRVWSRHVVPSEGFVTEEVDLSDFSDELIELRLVTEPGPQGDATADYAVWSELRLAGKPRRAPQRPHVLFIDADTLRADSLGMYGAERPTSPRLDAWAESKAVIYENGSTAANWTLPSTVSMLTGLSVTQHGVREFPRVLTEDAEPLALRLKRAGYETYARTDGGFVNAAFGFHLGFDVFDFNAYPHAEHFQRGWKAELEHLRSRRSERPAFYFLQTYMVHAPYMQDRRFADEEPRYTGPFTETRITQQYHKQVLQGTAPEMTADDWEYLRALYDAGVRRMDDVVMDFLDGAADVFGDEPYVVIFTSDHGEELADHGLFGHGHTLFREQLAVPFVLQFPDGRTGRERAPVSSLDLVPTVLELAGLPVDEHLAGRSLLGTLPQRRLLIAEDDQLTAGQLDGWKLFSGRSNSYGWKHDGQSLFRSSSDPMDAHDVLTEHDDVARGLQDQIDAFHSTHPPRFDTEAAAEAVDPAVVEQLKALGYLGEDG